MPRRVYINTKTGKQSIWLEDVLEEDVYVNRTLDCIKREPGGPFKKTMFGNIELVPHTKIMSAETGKLFTLPRDIILEKEEMIQRLIQLFSDAV
ncbi:MAG: hypothetical protein GWN00_33285, partial [Aliifodinibius sp.]|nr:hypothetical protein [Fodinibius sp.]NIY29489.1 hypothetical protein [Fodinibius sp.]